MSTGKKRKISLILFYGGLGIAGVAIGIWGLVVLGLGPVLAGIGMSIAAVGGIILIASSGGK